MADHFFFDTGAESDALAVHEPVKDLVPQELCVPWSTATSWWPCKSICRATWCNKIKDHVYCSKICGGKRSSQGKITSLPHNQLAVNSDTSDAKRQNSTRADRHTHTGRHTHFGVSGWLTLLLGLGLAFSYIILQRTEAQITGKANTGLWGVCARVCALALAVCSSYITNQNARHVSLYGCSFVWVRISSFNSTHSFRAVCIVDIWVMCLSLSSKLLCTSLKVHAAAVAST